MSIDKVRNGTKVEPLGWYAQSKPASPQQIAATVELRRRAVRINQIRFWAGFTVVAMALLLGTVALMRYLW
ncbi:MAG: hypothetical protein ABW047_07335 [Nitrospiraceae bacterium]